MRQTTTGLRSAYPLILTLDTHGVPHRWITWQHACYYYAKDQVAWTIGEQRLHRVRRA